MLLSQHAIHLVALQELYRRCVNGEGFPGSPLEVSPHGQPGTHAILDRLGLIKQAEMAIEDPHQILQEINEYVKSLEAACPDCTDSSESTEQSESTSQSEDPSPEPSTSPEPAPSLDSSTASSSNGTWEISPATGYCPVYGAGIDVQAPQQQQQQPNLVHSLNQAPFDAGFAEPHIIDGAPTYSPRYQFDDVACRKNMTTPPNYTWTVPYHDNAGFVHGQGPAHDGRVPFAASHVLPDRSAAYHGPVVGSRGR
ncbi:hypothetical protein VTN49DRAFT_2694 [Thermomyces lanuginosus]|uniref:uncharacterized protein n=1 Tax=Thermomyces lanuginosus TaxID=5541 RepID=UPI003743E021